MSYRQVQIRDDHEPNEATCSVYLCDTETTKKQIVNISLAFTEFLTSERQHRANSESKLLPLD